MYEHKKQPLAPKKVYYERVLYNIIIATLVLFFMLVLGIVGYYYLADMNFLQSLHNASMILSGMGPVFPEGYVMPVKGVWFSSFYALFSGVIFITNIGFILAPVIHRFFHKLHLEEN